MLLMYLIQLARPAKYGLRIRVFGIPLTNILEQINDKGAIKDSTRRWIWGELLSCKYTDT